ncbi:polysaccharide pyruvyl transferase family protein [Idiomarina seosinensis]|uniref:polysaccharide pyruvyl transferase family protein n=1 Tax=Idiomarina seosinensis TaxID=281739 RepID=UPI00384AD3FD
MVKPKLIEVKGVQFVNKGAELMLYAIKQQIENLWPNASVVLAPNPYSPYYERVAVNAYQKLSLRKHRLDVNALSYQLPTKLKSYLKHSWGIITESDIDLVLDASGFAYGDQWGSLKIKHLTSELKRYHKNNIPYIFLPQALGPFTRSKDIKQLKQGLPLATFIAAREETSFEHIKSVIGKADNLYQFPDFTNLVTGIVPDYFTGGDNKVLFIPNSNMVGARNTHKPEWRTKYINVLLNGIQVVKEMGLEPVLLNHEGSGDAALCQQLKQQSEIDIDIIEEPHPLKVKGIIGASKAVVCSRFHGCVSSLSQAVPCLGTSWSHKYERLFEDYEVKELLLEPNMDRLQFKKTLEQALTKETAQQLAEKSEQLKKNTKELWANIKSTVEA